MKNKICNFCLLEKLPEPVTSLYEAKSKKNIKFERPSMESSPYIDTSIIDIEQCNVTEPL